MRHELYCDFRDVVKWSCVLRLAGDSRWVTQVAMLRKDEGRGEGRDYRTVPEKVAEPKVIEFFRSQRQGFAHDVRKDLARIKELCARIDLILSLYAYRRRKSYFDEVIQMLKNRPIDRTDVVLVDPDNGLEPNKPGDKHVCLDDLARLFKELRAGDTLVVYQHCTHRPSWKESGRLALAEKLERKVDEPGVYEFADVCFYSVERK